MSSNPAELYQQAQKSMQEGDFQGAEKHFRMLIALLPDVPQPHYELAVLLTKMDKNPALVINHYEMFIQLAGDDPGLGKQIKEVRREIHHLLNPSPLEAALSQDDASSPDLDLPGDRIIVDQRGRGHFTSLGDAVANNLLGLPIHLQAGRYNESIMITNPDLELEIIGPASGEAAILTSASDHCLYLDCSKIEISNLTISNSSSKAAVQVVAGQVAFEECEFLDCTTCGISAQYEAQLFLKRGNVFFGGGTALQAVDRSYLEVGSAGPNFFYSNLSGSVFAAGESRISICQAGFNYRGDFVPEEVRDSLPYYGLGEVPVICLKGNVEATIKASKITGWGTLIQIVDQASVSFVGLESNSADGFSKQTCTPDKFLQAGDRAMIEIDGCAFSTDVVGATCVDCSGQAHVKVKDFVMGGEITMLKLDGGTCEVIGLDHLDEEGNNVKGLQAENGRLQIGESFLPYVEITGELEARFNRVRFGGNGAKGSAFRGELRFEHCDFAGSAHFDGQMNLIDCSAKNIFGGESWLSFYRGKVRIQGGVFINHAIAVGCNFEIIEAVFQFEKGYASPEGVIDFLQGAFGRLEKCSVRSSLPKTYPALRIHRNANVHRGENELHGKVKMYR